MADVPISDYEIAPAAIVLSPEAAIVRAALNLQAWLADQTVNRHPDVRADQAVTTVCVFTIDALNQLIQVNAPGLTHPA